MAAFVTADDLQSRAHGETNAGNKRIFEPDTVYIVSGGTANEFTGGLVAGQEAIENGGFDSRARHNLLGRQGALASGRRLQIAANKPAGKPSQRDLRHG